MTDEGFDISDWKDGCPVCDSKNVYQLVTEAIDGTNKVHAPWCEDCDPRLEGIE